MLFSIKMKPQSLAQCLAAADRILQGQDGGALCLMVGSCVKKTASLEKVRAQQAPLSLFRADRPVVVVLADPLFQQEDPVFLHHLETYLVQGHGTQVVDPRFPRTVWMKCPDFVQDRSHALSTLVRMVQHNPHTEFYLGDYTLTAPYLPFHEHPWLLQKVGGLPNVWLSRSSTREQFVNAQDL